MRAMITLTLACAGFAQMQPAFAETLLCGDVLVEPGDDAAYVLKNCGEPNSTAPSSTAYSLDVLRAGRWRYDRGPGLFPAVVVIGDNGRVEAIEFDTRRSSE